MAQAREYRHGGADRREPAQAARRPAAICGFALGPRINAGGRVGEVDARRAPAHHRGPGRGARHRRPALARSTKNAARSRRRCRRQPKRSSPRSTTARCIVRCRQGLAPRRDRDRRRADQGKDRQAQPSSSRSMPKAARARARAARSAGVDLGAAIIAAREAGLLVAGGGHAMAAGLTIDAGPARRISPSGSTRGWPRTLRGPCAEQTMLLDLALAPGGLTPELVETLEAPGPSASAGPARASRSGRCGW